MQGTLIFTSPDDVVADQERPGLLRAPTTPDGDGDVQRCQLLDLSAGGVVDPGLENAGFETIDVSGNAALQSALDGVREMDYLSDSAAAGIRESLDGTTVGLSNGASLRFDYIVEDGLFHRRAGPNGLDVNPDGMDGPNGHGGAKMVHGDQDVFGTPLRQLMNGGAPETFRHVTPDGRNDDAATFLLNLWIPLFAPVQPLALMDRRTLDVSRHQLRYGLPVDGFLDRDDDAKVNDIWKFLFDADQQWYIRSDMSSGHAYVFDTLGAPHGAAILPGEDALEELYVLLEAGCEAHGSGDVEAVRSITSQLPTLRPPADAPPTILEVWQKMSSLHKRLAVSDADEWCAQAQTAMSGVIRRSIEMRLVASLIAD